MHSLVAYNDMAMQATTGGYVRQAIPLLLATVLVAGSAVAYATDERQDQEQELRTQLARERDQWSTERTILLKANRKLRLAIGRGGTTAPSWHLRIIAACESGGNPRAISPGGKYRGKYQFDYTTWRSVGGWGDPAAAPEIEQDYRAWVLYSRRGAQPWPVCGR